MWLLSKSEQERAYSGTGTQPRHCTRDRDIGPATATVDPRPRHWTRDRDCGPATRDPRLLVKLRKLRLKQREKTLRGRLLEVTAVSIPANTDFFVIIYLQQGRTRRQLKWTDVSRIPLCSPFDIAMCPPDQWQWEITLRDRNGIYKVTCTMDSNGATLSSPGLGHNSYYSVICYQHKCTPY